MNIFHHSLSTIRQTARTIRLGLALGLTVTLAPVASASEIALSITGTPNTSNAPNMTVGWSFTVNSSITVTDLGYFDLGNDGLAASHVVGLWQDGTNTLLASATVLSGTAGTLVNDFRFVSLGSTVTLSSGITYVVGGVSTGDRVGYNTPVTMASGINYLEGRSVVGSTLAFPTDTISSTTSAAYYFGGNFLYATSSVPEPATCALLVLGGALVLWRTRRH